ncbi:hypothetical protein [uncultured Oscillibacter sp.]|uniref:hypothetical protein n=1 Tax=uncultured Oscillibacter sp. TaxID=876091 RepID=UPI00345D24A8
MDKLKMHTPSRADDNFRKLAAFFPNAVTETIDENGEVVRAIDKDVLMQEIATKVVDGSEERYQFTWPDKKRPFSRLMPRSIRRCAPAVRKALTSTVPKISTSRAIILRY